MSGYRVPPRVQNPTPGSAAWQRQVEQNLSVLGQRSNAQLGYRPPRRANGIAWPTYLYDTSGEPMGRLAFDTNAFQLFARGAATQLGYPPVNADDPFAVENYDIPLLSYNFGVGDDDSAYNKATVALGVPTRAGRLANLITLYGLVVTPNLATGAGTAVQIDGNGQLLKASSSRKYKQDINYDISLQHCINLVEGLRPATFRYIDDVAQSGDEAPVRMNFIAEDVAELEDANTLVHYVDGEPDALQEFSYKVVHTRVLQHLLTENRELRSIVLDLASRVEALEAQHATD